MGVKYTTRIVRLLDEAGQELIRVTLDHDDDLYSAVVSHCDRKAEFRAAFRKLSDALLYGVSYCERYQQYQTCSHIDVENQTLHLPNPPKGQSVGISTISAPAGFKKGLPERVRIRGRA